MPAQINSLFLSAFCLSSCSAASRTLSYASTYPQLRFRIPLTIPLSATNQPVCPIPFQTHESNGTVLQFPQTPMFVEQWTEPRVHDQNSRLYKNRSCYFISVPAFLFSAPGGNTQRVHQHSISDKAHFIHSCNGTQKTGLHRLRPITRRFSLPPLVPHWLSTSGSQSSWRSTKHTDNG